MGFLLKTSSVKVFRFVEWGRVKGPTKQKDFLHAVSATCGLIGCCTVLSYCLSVGPLCCIFQETTHTAPRTCCTCNFPIRLAEDKQTTDVKKRKEDNSDILELSLVGLYACNALASLASTYLPYVYIGDLCSPVSCYIFLGTGPPLFLPFL